MNRERQWLALLLLVCSANSASGFFNLFRGRSDGESSTQAQATTDATNPFAAVYHAPERESEKQRPPPTLSDKKLVFGSNGLPPSDNTCWSSEVPADPRKQKILIALEA